MASVGMKESSEREISANEEADNCSCQERSTSNHCNNVAIKTIMRKFCNKNMKMESHKCVADSPTFQIVEKFDDSCEHTHKEDVCSAGESSCVNIHDHESTIFPNAKPYRECVKFRPFTEMRGPTTNDGGERQHLTVEMHKEGTENDEEKPAKEDDIEKDQDLEVGEEEEQQQLRLERMTISDIVGHNGQDEDDDDDNRDGKEDKKGEECSGEEDEEEDDDEEEQDEKDEGELLPINHYARQDEEERTQHQPQQPGHINVLLFSWSSERAFDKEEIREQEKRKIFPDRPDTDEYVEGHHFVHVTCSKRGVAFNPVLQYSRLESESELSSHQIRNGRDEPILDAELVGDSGDVLKLGQHMCPDTMCSVRETGVEPTMTVFRDCNQTFTSLVCNDTSFLIYEVAENYNSELCGLDAHYQEPLVCLEHVTACKRHRDIALCSTISISTNVVCTGNIVETATASVQLQATLTHHPGFHGHSRYEILYASEGFPWGEQTAGQPHKRVEGEEGEDQNSGSPVGDDKYDKECPQVFSSGDSPLITVSPIHAGNTSPVDVFPVEETGLKDGDETSSTDSLPTSLPYFYSHSQISDTFGAHGMNQFKVGPVCYRSDGLWEQAENGSVDKTTDIGVTDATYLEKGLHSGERNDEDQPLKKDPREPRASPLQTQNYPEMRAMEKEIRQFVLQDVQKTERAVRDLETKVAELHEYQPAELKTNEKTTKDAEECDCDKSDELRRYFSPPLRLSPEFREWAVGMVRSPFKQQFQSMQQSASVSAGLKSEWKRLATFCHYEAPAGIYLIPIAAAGFFLVNEVDASNSNDAKVECAFCTVVVVIKRFCGRNAMALHAELKPQCRFVRGEDVGNISIAEAAERSGAVFVEKYSIPAGHASDATQRSLQTATSPVRRDHLAEVLATDSEPTAAEEPASYPLSLPTDKPGSVFSSLPADIEGAYPNGNNDSSRLRDTAGPLLQRDGTQGSGSRDVGETVADSRPALAAGTGGSHLAASASATAPSAGRTEMPYQTATFSTPEPQSSSSGTATPSQTTTANQPASNQTNGPHQTATVSAGPVTSGGTAREAPQSIAQGSEGVERSQISGNGGGTDSSGRSENGTERQLVTYEELGIFSQRPKRPDMAVTQVRINTFEGWPHQASHPKEEMAEAGFYYTGHADLVRCFHCKGGLKTWESSDQPWIEHSRWFPRCPFIKLCKGQKFVQAVQKLNDPDTRPTITESDVLVEIRRMEDEERSSLRDDVVLLENLPNPNAPADPVDAVLARTGLRVDADVTEASMQEVAERLAEENEELTSSTLCKMCQTNEVNVLFLPCGHLVSCAQCAPALRTCAMCRQPVRGSVRVLLDEKRESEEARQQPPSGAAASTH
ncbi:hypothetical protein V1264_024608 [Littorina saxatilis]|uniref:RING-type domain-containing protein n=2 Tax=Littorina saxatilis TaxID=31220 RepID=A0AAN9AMD2_9CAEN